MPQTTEFNIYKIKQEILNRLRANFNSYDVNTRVTERTTTFTGDGSTTKFLLSVHNLSYVKSVTINSVDKSFVTDWDISWRGTDKGKLILTSAPALGHSIVVVWGEKGANGQFVYSDFPKSNLGKNSYPRIGFKFTAISRAGGMGGSSHNVLVNEGLLQIKVVDLDTYEVDYLISEIRDYIAHHCKDFYYFNYIEPRAIAEYDNYDDNTEQTFAKFIEFNIPAKYEVVDYTAIIPPVPPVLTLIDEINSYYKFDPDANDYVSANHGIIIGATETLSGKIYEAFEFDGLSNYIIIPDRTVPRDNLTISGWVKLQDLSGTKTIFSQWNDINNLRSWALSYTSDGTNADISWNESGDGTTMSSIAIGTIPLNSWRHIVIAKNQSSVKTYINGALTNSSTSMVPILYNYGNVAKFGSNDGFGGNVTYAKMVIDEVGVWRRQLSQSEITELYNTGYGIQYPFDTQPPINGPPSIDSYTPVDLTPEITDLQTQTFTMTVSDPNLDPLDYEWYVDGTPQSVNDTTFIADGATLGVGNYIITAEVSDSVLTDTQTWNLSVVSYTNSLLTDIKSYYKYDGDVVDSLGLSNGTNVGISYTTGKILNGLDFVGAGSTYIDNGRMQWLEGATNFSVSCWVNDEGVGTGYPVLWGKMGNYPDDIYMGGDQSIYYIGIGASQFAHFNRSILSGALHHLVLTYDGTGATNEDKIKIYVDNVQIALTFTGTIPTTVSPTDTANMYIGEHGRALYETQYSWKGTVDEMGWWNKTLTPLEVSQLYNSGTGLQYPFTSQPPNPLLTNMVVYYKFDSDATDSIGTNDGVVRNATLVEGKIYDGYQFTGTGEITVPDSDDLHLTGEYTLNAWIKRPFNSTGYVFSKGGGPQYPDWSFTANSNDGYIGGYITGGEQYYGYGYPTDENWHMITVTHQTSGLGNQKIYVDGALLHTLTTSNSGNAGNPLYIGAWYPDSIPFTGIIDEVGIWKRALSSTEVAELYNSGLGIQYPFDTQPPSTLNSGIRAVWNLDESTPGTATDGTGTYNGTDVNTTVGAGLIDYARNFVRGNTGYVEMPVNSMTPNTTNIFTFNCWINVSSFPIGGDTRMSIFGNNTGTGWLEMALNGDGTSYFMVNDSSIINSTTSITPGSWFMLTGVFNGTEDKYYINGALQGVNTAIVHDLLNPLKIGLRQFNDSLEFNGKICLVGIWNRELTQSELNELYNSGAGKKYPY